jgi:MFS family permease
MQFTTPLAGIEQVIQLAIAPVFLLTAVGTLLGVLTNRLARAVDRRRVLTAVLPELGTEIAELARRELEFEHRRIRLVYVAISLAVMCALLICLLIALAFIDALVAIELATLIAVLFSLSMLALIGSLSVFLREIFLAVNSPRTPIR